MTGPCPSRMGTLVVPTEAGWIAQSCAADPTSASLRKTQLEGNACRARGCGMDYQTVFCGRDKRVPPRAESEGHACHARRGGMDDPTWYSGPDKCVTLKANRAKVRRTFLKQDADRSSTKNGPLAECGGSFWRFLANTWEAETKCICGENRSGGIDTPS
jgi:hypothetical protein